LKILLTLDWANRFLNKQPPGFCLRYRSSILYHVHWRRQYWENIQNTSIWST
jgi:hypothetical protein